MKKVTARNSSRIQDRLIDELIGICRGVIANGIVDEQEALFLGRWIENHRDISGRWPVNVLYARLTDMLKDGALSRDEQKELLETLQEITGETTMYVESNRSTTLPLDKPPPVVEIKDKTFCLTGRFVFGSNLDCEETIIDLGGSVVLAPGQETDFLVIGELCSADWAHTSFGRSIERAVDLQTQGHRLRIISEEHWVNALSV